MFAQSDEQQIVADNLRRFLQAENSHEQRRHRLKAWNRETRLTLWPGLAELGILAAAFPEGVGGLSGDQRTVAVVTAELGVSLVIEPFVDCAITAGNVLQQWRDEAARAVIGNLIEGKHVVVLAHDGPMDPFRQPTISARRHRGGFKLRGHIRCVSNADLADEYLLVASGDKGPMILRTPAAALGVTVEPYRLMDDTGAADLSLDVSLPASAEMMFAAPVHQVVTTALEAGALAAATETAAIAAALNAGTFQYLMTRSQFGAPIGSFQALQHRAADMYMGARSLMSIVNLAIDAAGASEGASRSSCVSAAKAEADRIGTLIGHEAVQMHGGMGVSEELIISHYARRLASLRARFGTSDIHRLRFASL